MGGDSAQFKSETGVWGWLLVVSSKFLVRENSFSG